MSTAYCVCEHEALRHEQIATTWNRLLLIGMQCQDCDCPKFIFDHTESDIPHHCKGPVIERCSPCREKAVRWMLRHPETDHIGRNGRRLAAILGIEE